MDTLKKVFWKFIKNNGKKIFIFIAFWSLLIAVFDIITPFFYKEIIAVLESYLKTNFFDQNKLFLIFAIWWVFLVVSTVFKSIIEYITWKANLKNYKKNHIKYSSKLLDMEYKNYLNEKSWTLFKIYDRGIEWEWDVIHIFFWELLISFVSIIIITIILFYLNIYLALATLAMMPFMIFISIFFYSKTRKLQDNINKFRDESFGTIWDSLSNFGLLKTLILEKTFKKKLKWIIEDADKEQKKVVYRWVLSEILTWILITISRALVLWVWIYLVYKWEISFALLFLFFAFVWHIYFPIIGISKRLKNIQKRIQDVSHFYDKFDNLEIEEQDENKKELENVLWNIEYKNISFSYTKDKQILKNINFKINHWQKVAFVWNTGAGKSTIVNLLFRFWEPNSGKILIDNENIQNFTKESLRKNIWLVMQDNSLFNTTIRENLLFANPNATDEELKQALKNAEADFVFNLKDGLNTIIWERGLKLSWWEKQRLSIARLFLKNPKILVLDEATSALDNKTEKKVQKALDKLMQWRTSIIIAHRLSTIENADKIFFLENGQIKEEWTYQELMNKKWKFYELANPEHLILS